MAIKDHPLRVRRTPRGEGIRGSDGGAALSCQTKEELASAPPGGGVRHRPAVTKEQATAAIARNQGERAGARARHWRQNEMANAIAVTVRVRRKLL